MSVGIPPATVNTTLWATGSLVIANVLKEWVMSAPYSPPAPVPDLGISMPCPWGTVSAVAMCLNFMLLIF